MNTNPQQSAPAIYPSALRLSQDADRCRKWLKDQGFEVLAVEKGKRNPRLTIRTSPLCGQLEGAVRMYERSTSGERRYWVAIRFGCEVRWTEGGAA